MRSLELRSVIRAALRGGLVAVAWGGALGCVPGVAHGTSGRELPLDGVRAIRPGETTARDVLARFGPPLAVGAPGDVLRVSGLGVRKLGEREVAATPEPGGWGSAAIRPGDLVYYYEAVAIRDQVPLLFFYPSGRVVGDLSRQTRIDRLWVLVSGDGRRVKAVAHDRKDVAAPGGAAPEVNP